MRITRLYGFPRAAITKDHKLGGLKQGGVFYQGPGGWKLKTKGSVGCASFVISREGSFLGFAADSLRGSLAFG